MAPAPLPGCCGQDGTYTVFVSIDCSPAGIIPAPSGIPRQRGRCVCVHMYAHMRSPVHTLILLKQQEEQSACC